MPHSPTSSSRSAHTPLPSSTSKVARSGFQILGQRGKEDLQRHPGEYANNPEKVDWGQPKTETSRPDENQNMSPVPADNWRVGSRERPCMGIRKAVPGRVRRMRRVVLTDAPSITGLWANEGESGRPSIRLRLAAYDDDYNAGRPQASCKSTCKTKLCGSLYKRPEYFTK